MCDAIDRKAVLMVGINWLHILNEVLCHILYSHWKMEFLNGCWVGPVYLKDYSTVNSDIYCGPGPFKQEKEETMVNFIG